MNKLLDTTENILP